MRTTKTQLRDTLARINLIHGLSLEIGWAYGRPRVSSDQGARDVSPRLPVGEMATWLAGLESGLDIAANQRRQS